MTLKRDTFGTPRLVLQKQPTTPYPTLFTDDQVESERTRRRPSPDASQTAPGRQMPFELLRRRYPKIAHRMETLWGTPAFDTYAARLVVEMREEQSPFGPDILDAVTALADHHRDYGRRSGPITLATGGPSLASLRAPDWLKR